MYRAVLFTLLAVFATACGSDDTAAEVVASVQVDDGHDVVVIRTDETDLTPSLLVCRVPHGRAPAADSTGCADVDPWRWSRTSIAANLDPGPSSSLLVVVHDLARFSLVEPAAMHQAVPIDLHLPAGPIGSVAPLTLQVVIAESDLTADNAIGCLTTGLAGGTNPVFITATNAANADVPLPAPPADLQTACL